MAAPISGVFLVLSPLAQLKDQNQQIPPLQWTLRATGHSLPKEMTDWQLGKANDEYTVVCSSAEAPSLIKCQMGPRLSITKHKQCLKACGPKPEYSIHMYPPCFRRIFISKTNTNHANHMTSCDMWFRRNKPPVQSPKSSLSPCHAIHAPNLPITPPRPPPKKKLPPSSTTRQNRVLPSRLHRDRSTARSARLAADARFMAADADGTPDPWRRRRC